MPWYEVITPLDNGGPEPIPAGERVELGKKEGDELVLIGALLHADKPKSAAPSSNGNAKPLAEQSIEELRATGKAEGLKGTNLWKDPAKAIAAIEKARAPKTDS